MECLLLLKLSHFFAHISPSLLLINQMARGVSEQRYGGLICLLDRHIELYHVLIRLSLICKSLEHVLHYPLVAR